MKIWHQSTCALLLAVTVVGSGCAGGDFTTREKGAGIGALGGAAAGGLIGSAVGHPGAGAAIGGGVGLGAGALNDSIPRYANVAKVVLDAITQYSADIRAGKLPGAVLVNTNVQLGLRLIAHRALLDRSPLSS